MEIKLQDVSKKYKKVQALDKINFTINQGELFTFIGPSGSGKSTLLRILAGMEKPEKGNVDFPFNNKEKRVLVFQDFHLFPHMNVFNNIAFGLKAEGKPKREIETTVEEYLGIFKIKDKTASYPAELSGGQKQRVALARAMVLKPALLLLDEPFANLDKQLKLETARFIKEIHNRTGVTTVCVTHDLEEAFAISDRMGILIKGHLHQTGKPEEIYFNPVNRESAELLGPVNSLSPSLQKEVLGESRKNEQLLRPESLQMGKIEKSTNKSLTGTITEKIFSGPFIRYFLSTDKGDLQIRSENNNFEEGDSVAITIKKNPHFKRSGQGERRVI
jgi:putative spermidine/putrescine transport system ATP-binding protein